MRVLCVIFSTCVICDVSNASQVCIYMYTHTPSCIGYYMYDLYESCASFASCVSMRIICNVCVHVCVYACMRVCICSASVVRQPGCGFGCMGKRRLEYVCGKWPELPKAACIVI